MEKDNKHTNKDFASSEGRATQVGKIGLLLHYGKDGTIFEMIKCKNNPMFHKYKQIVKPDHELKNHIDNSVLTRSISYRLTEGYEDVDTGMRQI